MTKLPDLPDEDVAPDVEEEVLTEEEEELESEED